MNDLHDLLPLALILCFGIFVQASAGFAAGLLIVPAMLWLGRTIPEAQTSLLIATIPQNLWGVWSFRESLSLRRVVWPGIARLVFLPLGLWALVGLELFSEVRLRQIVGGFVLTATLTFMIFQPRPRPQLHPLWSLLVFPLSGFLQGLVGMGGPPMVFWVQAHDWSTRQTRAFLFSMYLISIIPALGMLYAAFGERIIQPGMVAMLMIPLLLAITYVGLRFGTWLGRQRLRKLTLGLLLLMGVAGIAAPWLSR